MVIIEFGRERSIHNGRAARSQSSPPFFCLVRVPLVSPPPLGHVLLFAPSKLKGGNRERCAQDAHKVLTKLLTRHVHAITGKRHDTLDIILFLRHAQPFVVLSPYQHQHRERFLFQALVDINRNAGAPGI